MLENLTELRAERTHLVEEALDSGGVTVSCDERMKGLDEMPSRAVDLSLITRVNILSGSSSPLRPRRYHLELDDALGSQIHLHRSVELLVTQRNDDARALAQRRLDLRLEHDVREIRRSDLLLAFADQHQIHRELPARRLECVQRREARGLRTFRVGGASADHHLPDTGTIDDPPFEGR